MLIVTQFLKRMVQGEVLHFVLLQLKTSFIFLRGEESIKMNKDKISVSNRHKLITIKPVDEINNL